MNLLVAKLVSDTTLMKKICKNLISSNDFSFGHLNKFVAFRYLEEYKAKQEEENEIYEYDEDGNIIWTWKKVNFVVVEKSK